MKSIICISLVLSLSYRQIDLGMSSGRKSRGGTCERIIYPSCPISKMLYSESTTYDVRSPPSQKNTAIFPAKDRSHKKQKYRSNESLTFEDLHQMTLRGPHVTQYMYGLFDNGHIYMRKSQFTLVRYVQ